MERTTATTGSSSMNLIEVLRDYVDNMLSECTGRKALILDKETLIIVSLVYSRTQILQKEVFFIETLDNIPQEKLMHLKAVVFCRCNDTNAKKICDELVDPAFSSYNLYFSNVVHNDKIQKFAEADVHNVVQQVQEVYADFLAVNTELFSLNLHSTIGLIKPIQDWTLTEQAQSNRITDALFALIMATRSNPLIRYDQGSNLSKKIADMVHEKLQDDQEFVHKMSQNSRSDTHLLIIDRKQDPITPLLNQWTYQAQIHELLTIKDNRVDLKQVQGLSDEMKEIVLSSQDDQFFKEIMYKNYGEVAESIHKLVQKFLTDKQSQAQFKSIEDMQRVLENFPEFKKNERNTTKHFTLLEEMRKKIEARNLYQVSEIEQDLVAGKDNKKDYYKRIIEIVEDSQVSKLEKIRLLLLFSVRYENDSLVFSMKDKMRSNGISDEQLNLVSCLLDYAGKSERTTDLFGASDIVSKGIKMFSSLVKEDQNQNVFLQHKPLCVNLIDQIFKGKLSSKIFPATTSFDFKEIPDKLIVFYVGGTTFEEAREVSLQFNSGQNERVIIGGTTIHNSQSFLKEIAQVKHAKGKESTSINFEIE